MEKIVILANGEFPKSPLSLGYLDNAEKIVCCDGAADKLLRYGLEPYAIVGDMDSINPESPGKYKDRLYRNTEDQESNDLTKAISFCIGKGFLNVAILGATGLREDHTLGNISLLLEYAEYLSVRMVTDYGIFFPVNSGEMIKSYPGQQVSVFSVNRPAIVTSENLKYPMNELCLENLWTGSLNECISDNFVLSFKEGKLLVFLEF
jgi:thiamine pyrophosphokinase